MFYCESANPSSSVIRVLWCVAASTAVCVAVLYCRSSIPIGYVLGFLWGKSLTFQRVALRCSVLQCDAVH